MNKNEEMTKQFEEIWREHNDPEIRARKKKKRQKEEELKNKEEDWGLI